MNDTGRKPIEGRVSVRAGDSEQEFPIADPSLLQALHYQITGKTDTSVIRYREEVCISYEDIIQLCEKIKQFSNQYNPISLNCSISVGHHEGDILRFGTLESFKMYDKTITEPSDYITIEGSILLPGVGGGKPSSYSIEVMIKSFVMAKRDPFMKGVKDYSENNIVARFEYVHYLNFRAFNSVISDWVKGLPVVVAPHKKILNFISGREIPHICAALGTASAITLYWHTIGNSIEDVGLVVVLLSMISTISFAAYYAAFSLLLPDHSSNILYTQTRLNAGDERNLGAFEDAKRKFMRRVLGWPLFVASSIVLNVVGALFARHLLG